MGKWINADYIKAVMKGDRLMQGNCEYELWKQEVDKKVDAMPGIEVMDVVTAYQQGWCDALDASIKALNDAKFQLANADRKTEPQTERLCDNCEYYGGGEVCDHPSIGEVEMGGKGDTFPWIKETPKWCPLTDEPQISKIIEAYSKGFEDGAEAVKAMPQTCNNCDLERCDKCVAEIGKDEPQTDCEGCDRYEDGGEQCDMCALEKGKEDAQTERSE